MLDQHPLGKETAHDLLSSCIEACYDCGLACNTCADACLAEPDVSAIAGCIRLNLDCADLCLATGRVLSRQVQPEGGVLRALIDACVAACQVCGVVCETHGEHHEHCRVCAEACRRCEAACVDLLEAMKVS
jgi:hypothetical protein